MNSPTSQIFAVIATLLMCSACRGDSSSSKESIFTKEMLLADSVEVRVSEVFQVPAPGKYKLAVILYQKNAMKGSAMRITGEIKMLDSSGAILGNKMIAETTMANQTRLDLWTFDAKGVGGVGQKRLEILLSSEGAELQKQYTKAIVYIAPERKRGFLD
jgi:hypothetical protein